MSGTHGTGTTREGPAWPQVMALAIGVVYLLVGIVGFFITGFDDFAGNQQHDMLLIFRINPLQNVLHLVVGVIGLMLARTLPHARVYGWLLAVGYGAAAAYGLLAAGTDWDALSTNAADNVLHIATAVLGLAVALGSAHRASAERTEHV